VLTEVVVFAQLVYLPPETETEEQEAMMVEGEAATFAPPPAPPSSRG
jgi:hypothetical protein